MIKYRGTYIFIGLIMYTLLAIIINDDCDTNVKKSVLVVRLTD